MIRQIDRKNKFISVFDPKSGFYARTGVIENGKDTGVDPFMASAPSILDIGICGHCSCGLAGKCGVQCYQSGHTRRDPHMTLEEYKTIVDQAKRKTLQVALGGAGNPDEHPDFEAILKYTRENDIVPNFTTAGVTFDERKAAICKSWCGAVAVSHYRKPFSERAISLLLAAGVTTNIHYVLGNDSIDEAINRLKRKDFHEGVNAVVFLLHKPVGLGREDNVLRVDDPRVEEFFHLIDSETFPWSIGFDACSIPALLQFNHNIDPDSYDTCEGGRWSAYIGPDLRMTPCSFDQDHRWAVDLRTHTLQEAWDSPQFEDFRNRVRNACPGCKDREACKGGCPVRPQIVLCDREERKVPC